MAVQVQTRRGTSAEHSSFTGANGEITVDTDKEVVVVHDGATVGGYPLMRENGSNSALALGSAGTPSLKFTGDTNTGIYSPGADQVAISTGGSGRLFVDASGNVGINTASTIAPGGFGYAREFALTGATSGDSSAAINIRGSRTVSGGFGDINFWHQSTSNRAYIQARRGSSDSAIDLDFITSGGAGMRITSAGLVGIGTSSPGRNLHVAGSGATALIESTGSTNADLLIGDGGVRYYGIRGVAGGGSLQIRNDTANTTLATFTSTGLVGIGTTPVNTLDVNGTARIRLSGNNLVVTTEGGAPYLQSEQNVPLHFGTNSQLRATLDASGRFLVGTSTLGTQYGTPQVLVIGGSRPLTLSNAYEAGTYLEFNTGAANGNVEIKADARTGNYPPLLFTVGGSERMRISNNGQNDVFGSSTYVHIARSAQAAGFNYLYLGCYGATNTSDGTASFIVYTNGNVQNTNGSYTTISDKKLKENIVAAGSQWADLKAIQIRNWNFKADTGYETHRQIGPIAQELETICPGLVFETPDRDADGNETGEVTKGVNQSVLYMKAVKALQEAMERIETLESEMAAVKAQLA